jgi:hypothetical protein
MVFWLIMSVAIAAVFTSLILEIRAESAEKRTDRSSAPAKCQPDPDEQQPQAPQPPRSTLNHSQPS